MIQLQPKGYPVFHRLIANKKMNGWDSGALKDVLIAKYSTGKFAVMGLWFPDMFNPEKSRMDNFYQLFTEQELHDSFTEQFTNLSGFVKTELT